MMKRVYLKLVIPALLALCGCTQYNGHIGPIFGSWALTEMTEDGQPANPGIETVFSFQNEIVRVVGLVNSPYSSLTRYGNFTFSGDVLTMRFQAGPTESDSHLYMTPYWLQLPTDGSPIVFCVRKLNGSEMVLSLETDGKYLVYTFSKTW